MFLVFLSNIVGGKVIILFFILCKSFSLTYNMNMNKSIMLYFIMYNKNDLQRIKNKINPKP
jgi:hypothetical protein